MPYVVPRLESVEYTGSNVEGLQQVIDQVDYWQAATRSVTVDRVRWTGAEGDKITVPLNGYLVYNTDAGVLKGMSSDDYQIQYREAV
jgi:hypothetical protein